MCAPRSYARMAKRMLVDAAHPEETRVVVLAGHRLEEFDFETSTKKQIKGNIYLAKVIRVEPSLQAAFVEYGGNLHVFLAFNESHPDYYRIPVSDRRDLRDRGFEAQEDEEEPHDDFDRRHDDAAEPAHHPELDADRHEDPLAAEDLPPAEDFGRLKDESHRHDLGVSETSHVAMEVQNSRDDILYESSERYSDRDDAAIAEPMTEREDQGGAPAQPSAQHEGEVSAQGEDPHRDRAREEEPAEQSVLGEEAATASAGNFQEIGGAGDIGASANEDGSRSAVDAIETVGGGDEIEETSRPRARPHRHYKIQEVIKRRQIMLVQVTKEERGNKGAALTTFLSLAGRYCVLMPNTARGGGVSRKIQIG